MQCVPVVPERERLVARPWLDFSSVIPFDVDLLLLLVLFLFLCSFLFLFLSGGIGTVQCEEVGGGQQGGAGMPQCSQRRRGERGHRCYSSCKLYYPHLL